MAAAILITVFVALWIVKLCRPSPPPPETTIAKSEHADDSPELGVRATFIAGSITVERMLPALDFALEPNQSPDPQLPVGEFDGEFSVTFNTGRVRDAAIGAQWQGGSLIVKRGDKVLFADYAGDQPRTRLTTTPVHFGRRTEQITYSFRSDGTKPARLKALWQPLESEVPTTLPSAGVASHD